jgi:hypothetical protein
MSLSSIATAFGGIGVAATGGLSGLNQSLFQIALANLNWSRGYLWYVTLDGVPSPFHENGVLGFPATEVTYEISDGKEFQWDGAMESFAVPQRRGLCSVKITLLDDEQATMFTFFERWFNGIYNNRAGVLPVSEASLKMHITKLKATRTPATRHYHKSEVDSNQRGTTGGLLSKVLNPSAKATDFRTLLVFPRGPLQEVLNSDNGPRMYSIDLVIVRQWDADYGDPSKHDGYKLIDNGKVQGFLDKVADYI